MTAPRTRYYSAQLQSPIFRLPREVRDVIYEYYLLEQDGYHYDSEMGKLLYQNPSITPKQVVRIGLRITCRIAAEEMKNIAFRKIQFYPKPSDDDGGEYMKVRSRAGRFRCLLKYVERQKCRMLVCAAELLQTEDFTDIYNRYPSVEYWFRVPLRRAIARQTDELSPSTDEDVRSQAFSDALQHALVLAKNRHPSKFAKLVSPTFGLGDCPIGSVGLGMVQNNLFVEGALSDIYHWHPAPWCMPSEQELSRLEALICQPGNSDTCLPITKDGIFYYEDIRDHFDAAKSRWYFSAAAVAIDFLHRLPKERRCNLRSIVLNEDVKAVSRSECHARGLITFCLENSSLLVKRHIGLLTNLLPVESSEISADRHACIFTEDCFEALVPWIEDALLLPSHGMPEQSFQLLVDGVARESKEFWHMLKYAAATQEARQRQVLLSGIPLPPRITPPDYHNIYTVFSFPVDFAQSIRDIAQENSLVRYNGDAGELWDLDTFCFETRNWTLEQWESDWNEKINLVIASRFWLYVWDRYDIDTTGAPGSRNA
ncbi:uncharacterized protein J4E78_003328 [Alternaria triticimaculans]|uniref:uncharacterized protein n=1 Tax=Alternaria triticimaculans TaxID=297637 RepID=UPI0020C25275|nr:uncharacterized protein J4E78_003328 [Alternaria triticimaculans]KAI4665863.1 hypothetical protein J4E78_003328 [Alternaria triticimaculans]